MRLIDADVLDNAFTRLRFNADGELVHWGDRKDWCLHGSEVETLIADAPTVDAVPVKHGWWIYKGVRGRFPVCECSVCGNAENADWAVLGDNVNYCPNCGARMDGEEK